MSAPAFTRMRMRADASQARALEASFSQKGAGVDTLKRCDQGRVDAGGRAVFEETVEMIGLRGHMLERAANAEAKQQLAAAYDKAERYCRSVRQWSPSGSRCNPHRG